MKIEPMENEYSPEPQYPYGTRIELDDELAVKLGYDKFAAGTYVEVRAIAFIARKSESADADDAAEGESEKSMCLQLTDIEVKKAKSDRIKALYGE